MLVGGLFGLWALLLFWCFFVFLLLFLSVCGSSVDLVVVCFFVFLSVAFFFCPFGGLWVCFVFGGYLLFAGCVFPFSFPYGFDSLVVSCVFWVDFG